MRTLLLSINDATKGKGFGMLVLYFVLFITVCALIWYAALSIFRYINKINRQ